MLIGFTGPEGAGKSTAAKLVAEARGLPIHPFAAPLKRMIEALGVAPRHMYGTPYDKAESLAIFGGRSAREAMQTLGTEWGRAQFGPDFWVRSWLATLPAGGAVADDCRFASEVDAIRSRGGVVIQIVRSLDDVSRVPRHASEDFASLAYDVRVVNNKCPNVLRNKLIVALNEWSVSQSAATRVLAAE